MAIKIPYLSEDRIEHAAAVLLADYANARGITVTPPIPVEHILEAHLRLTLDFEDLHQMLGIPVPEEEPEWDYPEVLGALWVDTREVFIDQSLDPDENPLNDGRYRFTLGHEVGHWQLHRQYLESTPAQASRFGIRCEPAIICRKSQAKERIEWQANFFASSLLMPKATLAGAWRDRFGDLVPRIVRHDDTLWRFVRPFAAQFGVSSTPMKIRLETVGLLYPEMTRQRVLVDTA